jgi:coenzyme F420-reducing hydrogenase gamma subunit
MLLNLEGELAKLFGLIRSKGFHLVSSEREHLQNIDLALVEGSISTSRELDHLLVLREKSQVLVAVGLCATSGGINALANSDRSTAFHQVYATGMSSIRTFHPQPLHHFVHIDASIYGCPPERHDYINLIAALLRGGQPGRQEMPVCMECRTAENRCLLIEDKEPCLGPLTRSGCGARCPSIGVGCEGCRGSFADANHKEMVVLLTRLGLSNMEVNRRMNRFEKTQNG